MWRVRPVSALALTAAAVAMAGCSSGSSARPPSPTSTPSASGAFAQRYADGQAMLVQCGLTRGTIKSPAGQPWLTSGKILPLSGSGSADRAAQFSTWWDADKATVIGGKSLSDWDESAATSDTLPSAVCGPGASAASLMAQIYPGQADPW